MGVVGAMKWQVFPCVEVEHCQMVSPEAHLSSTYHNSSQFDGQAFWPVVWQFPARWILVHLHHCHLKTTQALKHIRQAQENSLKKSRPVNHWQ